MGGPPVKAMLIQNSNTALVASDTAAVRRGLSRDDLFVCVQEHFPDRDGPIRRYSPPGDNVPRTR